MIYDVQSQEAMSRLQLNFNTSGRTFPTATPGRPIDYSENFVNNKNFHNLPSYTHTNYSANDTDGELPAEEGFHWPALLLFLVIIATVWGNFMVCLAVKCEKKLRNRFNYFLVSLALSDMLCALVVMPGSVIKLFLGYLPVERTFCLVWFSLDVFFTASTVIHLCTISTDRYFALKDPIKYHQNKQSCHMTLKISIVWILAFCCAGPLFILTLMFERTPYSSYKGCGPVNATFVVSATVISFYLPLLIMLVTYILTVYTLRQQTSALAIMRPRPAKEEVSENELTLVSTVDSPLHRFRSSSARSHQEHQMILPNGRSSSFRDTYDSRGRTVPISSYYDMKSDSYQTDVITETNGNNNTSSNSPTHQPVSEQASDVNPNTLSPYHANHVKNNIKRDTSVRSVRSTSSRGSFRSIPGDAEYSPHRTWSTRGESSKVRLIIRRTMSDTPDARGSVRRTAAENVHKGRKAVHILGILFAAFVIFYLPFFSAYLISGVCVSCRTVITAEMVTALEWVEYAGSMVNPIIYRIFNPEFRKAFHHLMRCNYRRKGGTSSHVV